jgi:N-ethylmaleimide reductase
MDWDVHGILRPLFDGPYMAVSGFTRRSAAQMIASVGADMVAFGQAYLANRIWMRGSARAMG